MKKLLITATFIFLTLTVVANVPLASLELEATTHPHPNPEEVISRLDTDKDGKISKEEAKGPLLKNFARVDADTDGFISLEELKVAAALRRDRSRRPNPEEVISRLDADKDGKISKEEAKGLLLKNFARVDANNDGLISLEELKVAAELRGDKSRRPNPDEVISSLDTDKDGKISKEEAKGPLLKNFARVDTNKDGYATLEELKNAPKSGRKNRAKRK